MAPKIFWSAGYQPQPMFWSLRPERCVEKLQIGAPKQILPQLDPVDFGVHDMEGAGCLGLEASTTRFFFYWLLPEGAAVVV
jgi:hypothetical protein